MQNRFFNFGSVSFRFLIKVGIRFEMSSVPLKKRGLVRIL